MDSVFGLGPFLIPISAIVIGGVIVVVKMILSHQERIAKIERGIDPDVPRRIVQAVLVQVAAANLMLGVNATTESVSRFNESCLAPNIGLEELWGLHTPELGRPIPAPAG
jgi:hypothetical protein